MRLRAVVVLVFLLAGYLYIVARLLRSGSGGRKRLGVLLLVALAASALATAAFIKRVNENEPIDVPAALVELPAATS